MSDSAFKVQETPGQLVLEHAELFVGDTATAPWRVESVGGSCLLLSRKDSNAGDTQTAVVAGETLLGWIESVAKRKISGIFEIEGIGGMQRLTFNRGELVFGGSTLMDHRLGEVMYRNGGIGLERLTLSASQVNRVQKFGQILVNSGHMSPVQLWYALSDQVRIITQFIFLAPRAAVEFKPIVGEPGNAIRFDNGGIDIVRQSYFFGLVFRDFVNRLDYQAEMQPQMARIPEEFRAEGSYISDMLALMQEKPTVVGFIEASKMAPINTLLTMFEMYNRNWLHLSRMKALPPGAHELMPRDLKSAIDTYEFILTKLSKAFEQQKKPMPLDQIQIFNREFDPQFHSPLQFDDKGQISREHGYWMALQASVDGERGSFFVSELLGLCHFMLQMAGDMLPREVVQQIRNEYKLLQE